MKFPSFTDVKLNSDLERFRKELDPDAGESKSCSRNKENWHWLKVKCAVSVIGSPLFLLWDFLACWGDWDGGK